MLCAVMDLHRAYEAEARVALGLYAWTREALRHARRHEEALDCLFSRVEKELEAQWLLPECLHELRKNGCDAKISLD